MENVYSLEEERVPGVAVTGEVVYESVYRNVNKKTLKALVHGSIEQRVREIPDKLVWASYLVIFSPGQNFEEVRCQVDVETDGERSGFAIGYGSQPAQAFQDAIERMQWYEKNAPIRISV